MKHLPAIVIFAACIAALIYPQAAVLYLGLGIVVGAVLRIVG